VGSSSQVLFHHAVSATIPRGPDAGRAYPVAEAPGTGDQMPGTLLGRVGRGVGWICSEILSAQV
jgi:hypothetical protein